MNMKSKIERLAKYLKEANWDEVTIEGLFRLVDGDLSHIGDGLLKGRSLFYEGKRITYTMLDEDSSKYSLEPSKRVVFGEVVEEFVEEDFEGDGKLKVYRVYLDRDQGRHTVSEHLGDKRWIQRYLDVYAFKREEDAYAVAKSLDGLAGIK